MTTEDWARWHAKMGDAAKKGGTHVHVEYHHGSKHEDAAYHVKVKTQSGRTVGHGPKFPVPRMAGPQGGTNFARDKIAGRAHAEAHATAKQLASNHGMHHVPSGRHEKDNVSG